MKPTSPEPEPSCDSTSERRRTLYVPADRNVLLDFRSELELASGHDTGRAEALVEAPAPGTDEQRRQTSATGRRATPAALLTAAIIPAVLTVAMVWVWTREAPAGTTAAVAMLPQYEAAGAVPSPPPRAAGTLDISSDPAGARVVVDGAARGITPVILRDIEPGPHDVSVIAGATTFRRTLLVEPGSTSTVLAAVVQDRAPATPAVQPANGARPDQPGRVAPGAEPSGGGEEHTRTRASGPPAPVGSTGTVYTRLSTNVTPPVDGVRRMPEWNPPEGLAGRAYRGFIEVLVDTNGRVQDVRLLQRIAPLYDDALISAAWDWTFEPARLNGRPVLFRHLIEIVMGR